MNITLSALALSIMIMAACNSTAPHAPAPACVLAGGSVPVVADASWTEIDANNPLVPVRFKLPPGVTGQLYNVTPTSALYVVGLGAGAESAALQLGTTTDSSPAAFVALLKETGSTFTPDVRSSTLAGRAATEACGPITTSLPHAMVMGDSGSSFDVAAHDDHDFARMLYVPMDGHVFLAGYRLPAHQRAQYEPIFQAILATLTWK